MREENSIAKTTDEIKELLIEKNRKYGDNNLCTHGHMGIIIRMSDKIARLENLSKIEVEEDDIKGFDKREAAMEDAYKDLAGYCINALRLMRDRRI